LSQASRFSTSSLADALRENACVIHCTETASQLASIEASSLSAPPGLADGARTCRGLAASGSSV
jgi:hypothetical protein